MENSSAVLRIDCADCRMYATPTCDDCLVTFLCNRDEGGAVVVDVAEHRALRLLQLEGLAPQLRHAWR